jgi:hypothetical protein
MACVLVLAFAGWHGATAGACFGADGPARFDDGGEDIPDMSYVKAQAEAGRAKSQTQLADFFLASSDFTNAVIWYRKAADQGDVPAQLSLAGCLMSGRGSAKDAPGAARLLRQAADRIEFGGEPRKTAAAAPASTRTITRVAARSIVITKEAVAGLTNAPMATPAPHAIVPLARLTQTNTLRGGRVETLAVTDAVLQEAQPALGTPSNPR